MTDNTKNRVNLSLDDEMFARLEAWRIAQHAKTGRIPPMSEAARTLIFKGLKAERSE